VKTTSKEVDGTSFYEVTIKCSTSTLRKVLGEPECESNDGQSKVNFEWTMETDNGDVFTVYDWKEYRSLGESDTIEWHIGGYSKTVTQQAKCEIRQAMMNV